MKSRMAGVWAACVVLAGGAGLARAQFEQPRSSTENPPASVDLNDFLARSIVRVSLFDLRVTQPTLPRDYAAAAVLLNEARRYDPNDADLLRRWIEASWSAGDSKAVQEGSRRLAELDPADTVNQLRLITGAISREQTVAGRLALYEKFVALPDASLDPSVRSRLALDAALLLRERGDDRGFVERLTKAVTLDSTNKDAALVAYNLYCERGSDPMGRVELLSNLLMADPLDPNVLRDLRDEMARGGAVRAARRFHRDSSEVLAAARVQGTLESSLQGLVLDWLCDGAGRQIRALNDQLMAERERVRSAQRQVEAGVPQLGMERGKPEDRHLLPEVERLRCSLAMSLHDNEAVTGSMAEMGVSTGSEIASLANAKTRPPTMSEQEAKARVVDQSAWLGLYRLLSNVDSTLTLRESVPVESVLEEDDPRRAAIGAWRLYRSGDRAGALSLVAENADNPWCVFLLGQLASDAGDKARAAAAYRHAFELAPMTPIGGLAASLALELTPADPNLTPRSAALEQYAKGIPGWVDTMVSLPRSFQTMDATASQQSAGALDRVMLKVTLKNVAPVPLALGSDRTISSRFLLIPNLETMPGGSNEAAEPEVCEVSKRLRLMPGERVSAEVWPESGLTGWLSEVAAPAAVRTRWRVIQGFQPASNGTQEAGPGSLECNVPAVTRRPLPMCQLPGSEILAKLPGAKANEVPDLLVAARTALFTIVADTPADLARTHNAIADAIMQGYPKWSPELRTLAAAILPPAAMVPELDKLDAMILADADPKVIPIAIVTRATTPDNPALRAAEASEDPALRNLAQVQRARIAENARCYATIGIRVREQPKPGGQ